MLLIDSLYVNESGSLILLNYLIKEIETARIDTIYLLDYRNPEYYKDIEEKRIIRFEPSLRKRKIFYEDLDQRITKILCFGNIPPPVKLKGISVFTYLHQSLYISKEFLKMPIKNRFFFWLKEQYIKLKLQNTDEVWVQTQHMAKGFEKKYSFSSNAIKVFPFFIDIENIKAVKQENTFCYISKGYTHKNHKRLLSVWKRINQIYPEAQLHVTIAKAEFFKLYCDIEKEVSMGSNIINHQNISFTEVQELLSTSEYCIYPSLTESFGLGLVEAYNADCKIIAANLPYTTSVLQPDYTFNPTSTDSIYRCVLELLSGNTNNTTAKLLMRNRINDIISRLQ